MSEPGLKLNKAEKLRRSRQFQEIYSRGRRLNGPHLIFFFMPNRLKHNRLGLSVSKSKIALSVRRHYIQRRLREAYRLNKMRFSPGYDIVLGIRRWPGSSGKPSGARRTKRHVQRFAQQKTGFTDIQNEVLTLACRAGLLKKYENIKHYSD